MEKEEVSRVLVDYRVLASSPTPIFFPGMVVDFSYLEDACDVEEIEERKARPGDKAAADLPELAVDEDGNVMELVNQEYIRVLLKSPPRSKPLPDYSIEALRLRGIKDAEQLEMLSSSGQILQRQRDSQIDIIQQYLDKRRGFSTLQEARQRLESNGRKMKGGQRYCSSLPCKKQGRESGALDKGYAYVALPANSKRYPATPAELPPLP
ncbi:hypothetical protein QYE76_037854 [Lolium multiflorum]|uniref:Uncharacterized protein n=1 Tax=Lolium multiflorum TaxID=4521 RepID=A0AAD8T8G4_LOLMU|nr:hypothetical protein QYE76_037854 [Lolium multiflorum]